MKKITLFLFVVMPCIVSATVRSLNISDAIKANIVKVKAVNFKGNYIGRSVRLSVTNTKKDSLSLVIDLGIILKPSDKDYQPMVLAGEEKLLLGPNKQDNVEVEVFCGNSPLHCPSFNLSYSFSGVGSDTLIRVLRFINDHSLFDYLGQNAVWAITNHHDIACVYDDEKDAVSKSLIDVLCAATGRPHPDYYKLTAAQTTPGAAAYVPRTTGIIAQFDVKLRTATILSVSVFDVNGHDIEKVLDRQMFVTGQHRIDATFDPLPYGPGTYYLRLSNAEGILQEKKVIAEK
jgi:hypothetical protein